ncbi:response regulator transcription factor [Gorillibacterium sp. sgz500922]|uniref:response regulator transcription factor n=1 Tax=Gorillibacterium sp. sgz500922 TaxID=3446694 RepID=UPI003F67B038
MFSILLVDDEPYICKGLSNLLASAGLPIRQILTAQNGYEALDYLRMEEIDLLVTDIQMGSMSGIDLMHQAKMIKPWVQTIVISAHETFQYAQMAIRLGARDYLIKPINSEQFLDSVRSVLLRLERPMASGEEVLSGMRENFRMAEPVPERSRLLSALLEGEVKPDQAVARLEESHGVRLAGPYYSVLRIRLDLDTPGREKHWTDRDKTLMTYAALNIASELLEADWHPYLFSLTAGEIVILLQWSEEGYALMGNDKINHLDMIGRSLHFNIDKYLGVPAVIGVSQLLKGLGFLSELNEQAKKAIRWNGRNEEHAVFYYGDFHWTTYGQEEPSEEEMSAQNNLIVEQALAYMSEHYSDKGLTLHQVAQKCHVSPNYLSYLFKKNTGFNLWEYVIKLRMEESRRLLLASDMRRYEIAEKVGYESPEHFSKIFKKYFGYSPSECKK